MKPWQETWIAVDVSTPYPRSQGGPLESQVRIVLMPPMASNDESFDRGKLAAAAPEMVRVLLASEWEGGDDLAQCSACKGLQHALSTTPAGHDVGCPWDAVLTKAGFPDQASRDAARKEMGE